MNVINKCITGVSTVLFIGILSAGAQLGAADETFNEVPVNMENFVQCSTPRPEICYELYQPVCATRDTGIRCVTTPCPSTELATYSNDCKACSDPSVMGFVVGGTCKDSALSVDLMQRMGL